MEFIFNVMAKKSMTLFSFNYLCKPIRLCTVQVKSYVVTKRIINLSRKVYLIQWMTSIQRRKLWTYIFLMDPVCAERQKNWRFVYPMLLFIIVAEHTCHNIFKRWEYVEEIIKLRRENKVCWNSTKTEIWVITGELIRELISRNFPSLLIPPFFSTLHCFPS